MNVNSSSGVVLYNAKTIEDCGLKDDDVLFIERRIEKVKLYFKTVEPRQYVPGSSEGYTADKDQTIEDLKISVIGNYHDALPNVTPSWLFKLNWDSGVVLDNSKTIKECGLKDNDILFIQDPDAVKLSYQDNGTRRFLFPRRNDTIQSLKKQAKGELANEYDFMLPGRDLQDDFMVHSFFDNVSPDLGLEISLKPGRITPGILEGDYRLLNRALDTYIYVNPSTLALSTTTSASSATCFKFELTSNDVTEPRLVWISLLDHNCGFPLYLTATDVARAEYRAELSTWKMTWAITAPVAKQKQRYCIVRAKSPGWQLTIRNSQLLLAGDSVHYQQDWSFV